MRKLLLSITVFLVGCFQLNAQAVPTGSLFAYYPFTGNFTIGSDSSGSSRNLPYAGGGIVKDRFLGFEKAVSFDGTSQYLSNINGGSVMLVTGNVISISFWYKTASTAYAGLIDNSRGPESYGIDNFGGNIRFLGGGNFSAPIFQADNQWHHIAFTKNGTKGIFYKDGVATDSTNSMTAISAPTGTVQFNIGRRNLGTNYFLGNLDDVAIYTRVLTAAEIAAIHNYNGGPLVIDNNFFASYPFTNGSMLDFSPNSNNLQNFFTDTITDRFSQLKNAMTFNAANHSNLVGYGTQGLSNGNSISISFWYKTTATIYAGIIDNSNGANSFGIDNYQGKFRFLGGGNFSASIFQPDGQWHHIVFTKNGTKGIFYKDGIAADSTNSMTMINLPAVGQDLTIGSRNLYNSGSGYYSNYFTGQLDDISIYANTLSPSQVNGIYHQGGYIPLGAIINPPNVAACPGVTYTLDVSSANAANYQWKKNGVNLINNSDYAGVNTGVLSIMNYNASLTGTYTVYYANTFTNNITPSTSGVFSMGTVPTITITSSNALLCAGQTSTITASGIGLYTEWSNGNINPWIVVSPTVSTVYTATITSSDGCTNTSSFTQSVSTCTGIKDQIKHDELFVYPVPAKDVLFIDVNSISDVVYVKLSDVTGRTVLYHETTDETKLEFNISQLMAGVYFLEAKTKGKIVTQKIIKE